MKIFEEYSFESIEQLRLVHQNRILLLTIVIYQYSFFDYR